MTARVSADLAPRTLLVMAGGTGGHIFPALSVAKLLAGRGWRVVWLGNANGMEGQLVPKHGFPLESVQFGGLRGKGLVTKFLLPLNLLRAFWQSLGVVRRVRPNVVLGMGGYITFPGGMMSVLLGRPLVLHEQNSIAGLANRVLARVADRVLCAFPNALSGAEWVGNPIRADLAMLASPQARYAERTGPLRVLVVGGSLGAAALNDVVPKALALLPADTRPIVIHQAGAKQIDTLRANYAAAGVEGELVGSGHEADALDQRRVDPPVGVGLHRGDPLPLAVLQPEEIDRQARGRPAEGGVEHMRRQSSGLGHARSSAASMMKGSS